MHSTCLLLIIAQAENEKGLMSGKLFEYLATRKFIVAVGPKNGDASDLINSCHAGRLFGRDEEGQLFEYMNTLVMEWKKNPNLDLNKDAEDMKIIEKFSRVDLTETLVKIINS